MDYIEWLGMSSEELKSQLADRFKCDQNQIDYLYSEITSIDPTLRSCFAKIWANDEYDEIFVHGYSIKSLSRRFGMDPFKGILTLDWLMREPEIAKKALIRGYDSAI